MLFSARLSVPIFPHCSNNDRIDSAVKASFDSFCIKTAEISNSDSLYVHIIPPSPSRQMMNRFISMLLADKIIKAERGTFRATITATYLP